MQAVGYLRELPHAAPALSLERQQRVFLLACADAGLEPGAVFTDVASEPGQPELRRLLRLAAAPGAHGFAALVAAAPAVLGDTARDQWLRALQAGALGLSLRFAIPWPGAAPETAPGGETTPRDADAALVASWRARAPAERRRERSLAGMRRRALRGEVLGRPPYGYRVERTAPGAGVAAGRSRLAPDPAEAPVVRGIFARYLAQGEGVRRIAAALNADGVRTRRGGAWNVASVRALLRNVVYTGMYRRLGVTIPGAHEALVSRADFGAVQRRLDARRTSRGGARRRDYPLSAVARCGYCGSGLVGGARAARGPSGAGAERRTYRCGAAVNQGRCHARAHPADALEAEVVDAVAAGPAAAPRRAPVLPESPERDAGGDGARARALRRELDRLVERHVAGESTRDDLQRRGGRVALELLAIEERAAGAPPAAGPDGRGHAEARRRLAGAWRDLDPAERRTLLLEVVREVIVTDDDVRVALAP